MRWLTALRAASLGACLGVSALAATKPDSKQTLGIDFARDVRPLLTQYCYPCHGEKKRGGLDMRIFTEDAIVRTNRAVFEKVLKNLQAHEMPPESRPQPSEAERNLITTWAGAFFFQCDCQHPDPGRVTVRRLNRAEYNNSIRDLFGTDFHLVDELPADDSGYGFDNIGDVLSLSPLLMEKYLRAAEKILGAMIPAAASTNSSPDPVEPRIAQARAQLFLSQPGTETKDDRARRIITQFASRAFRRPLEPDDADRLMGLFHEADARGERFEDCVGLALEAVLVSPQFLFRGEATGKYAQKAGGSQPIDEYALATRLSYFLWSSMPDAELLANASAGTLRKNLGPEVERMLKDSRAHALVENFAGQWLQLRNLGLSTPDPVLFPAFDEPLRTAMRMETELFFDYILDRNRNVCEFVDADYTFMNERLARFYGITDVKGDDFKRVSLHGHQRGGLLGQASILTLTSNPTRTSPVKRGKWILENILADPPPPPPPNVPLLKEGKTALAGTLRQRMEQHRNDPSCASCHARMDPIGFGMENYDGIGAWREKDDGAEIDASGKLVSGEAFNGLTGIKAILLKQKRDQFVKCLTQKMLTYALGRGLEYYDVCAVNKITQAMSRDHYRFHTLIMQIVESVPFQMRRAESPAPAGELSSTKDP